MSDLGAGRVPHPVTRLIGRDVDVAEARRLLDMSRLLTLLGPAGVGKTRLALEIAATVGDAYPGGVFFVDLTPVRDRAGVVATIAGGVGVQDRGAAPVAVTLARRLSGQRVLLVLDNFEQALPAADEVVDLLDGCRDLRVVVTSRAPLQVPGEQLSPIGPLLVPDLRTAQQVAELLATPSVELLVERICATLPGFALTEGTAGQVAAICVALDGLPLALELAAARVRSYGLDEVLAGMRSRLTLLQGPGRGGPARHRSLADAVRWSVELLSEPALRCFAEVSVFAGGWTADAARVVCGADVLPALAELVDQSLVVADVTVTGVRYRMLETLREYAAVLLDGRGDAAEVRRRHLLWCTKLAEEGARAFHISAGDAFDRADAEFANLQVALARCDSVEDAMRLAIPLAWYWDIRGRLSTGRAHFERLLGAGDGDLVLRGWMQAALGRFAMNQDDHDTAQPAFDESAALFTEAGEMYGVQWARSLQTISAVMLDDPDLAQRCAAQAVAAAPDEMPHARGQAQFSDALARWCCGDHQGALDAMARSWAADPPEQKARWARGRIGYWVGWFCYRNGDPAAEQELAEAALRLDGLGDRRSVVDCLDLLGCIAVQRGDGAAAVRMCAVARRIRDITGLVRHRYLDAHVAPIEAAARAGLGTVAVRRAESQVRQLTVAQLLAEPPARVLTGREDEVARLVAQGMTNRQIGRALGISERTAQRHVENLRGKLGLVSRAQVAAWVAGGETPTHAN